MNKMEMILLSSLTWLQLLKIRPDPGLLITYQGLSMIIRRKSSKFLIDTFPELFPQRELFVLLKREILERYHKIQNSLKALSGGVLRDIFKGNAFSGQAAPAGSGTKAHRTVTGLRRFLSVVSFSLISTGLFAPGNHTVSIASFQAINPYLSLLLATAMVETLGNPMAYNEEENAVGLLQIRQVRIDDYNRRTGSNLTLEQMYDIDLSVRVFMYYASLEPPENLEKISKAWNGSGPMTELYWLRIKEYL